MIQNEETYTLLSLRYLPRGPNEDQSVGNKSMAQLGIEPRPSLYASDALTIEPSGQFKVRIQIPTPLLIRNWLTQATSLDPIPLLNHHIDRTQSSISQLHVTAVLFTHCVSRMIKWPGPNTPNKVAATMLEIKVRLDWGLNPDLHFTLVML